jgi:copper transport protein
MRWLLFAGLAVAAGEVVGRRLTRRAAKGGGPRPWRRSAAALGAVAASGLFVHVTLTGGGGRAVPPLAVEVAGFMAVAMADGRLAVAGLAAVVGAEGWRNHLGSQDGLPGAVVIAVHLAAVAVWVGTLVYVLRTARAHRWFGPAVRRLVAAYARLALTLVVLVVGTGTVAALLLVPSVAALVDTGYGRALLAKLALVAVVLGLAWVGRRRHRAGQRLANVGRAAGGEAGVLAAVLAVTALLVSLPTPAPATEDLGVPFAATGPVVRLGTLAGNVAVGLAASENQLELRLQVPDDSVQLGAAPPPRYRVSARVASTGVAPATVPLRGCGPGCLLGPVTWRAGVTTHVDLQVAADGWHGGAVLLSVPWPPRVDEQTLPRMVEKMRAQDPFTVVETTTSDTSRPDPPAQTVTVSGPEFLDSEPYDEPAAIEAVRLPDVDGRTVIAFGLPADGISVVLEVDDRGRIVRETLAAPNHLVRRVFEYGPT